MTKTITMQNFSTLLFLIGAVAILFACQSKNNPEPEKAKSVGNISLESQITKVLYVHAGKGLVLRDKPSAQGAAIATIAYGSKIEALSATTEGETYLAEQVGNYQLAGKWLNVKTADGKVGYVFERYVFPFATHKADYGQESYFEWFYQQYASGVHVETTTEDSTAFREGAIDGRSTLFNDGAEFEFAMYEGGISEFLRIPAGKMKIEDALVIFRAFHFRGQDQVTTTYDVSLKSIFVNGEAFALQLQEKDGFLEIAFHGS